MKSDNELHIEFEQIRRERDALDLRERIAVVEARRAAWTWARIAESLHLSRVGARNRHEDVARHEYDDVDDDDISAVIEERQRKIDHARGARRKGNYS